MSEQEWKTVRLGTLAKGIRGVSYQPHQLIDERSDRSATLLRANNIQGGRLDFHDVQIVPKSIVKLSQLLKRDDIVVCMSNGSRHLVGKAARFVAGPDSNQTVGAFCAIFRATGDVENTYLEQVFQSDTYIAHIDFSLAGSAINNLKNSDIESLKISIPPRPAQQKIARTLRTVDRAMEKTEALIGKYQQIKAGLMHDLFTRGLWTQKELDCGDHKCTPAEVTAKPGQLRPTRQDAPQLYQETPIGWIPKKWGYFLLDGSDVSIIDGDRGVNYPKDEDFSDEGHCLFLSATNVTKDGFLFDQVQFITKQKHQLLRAGTLNHGDIVVTTRGTVGNIAYLDDSIRFQCIRINSGMILLRSAREDLRTEYIYHSLKDFFFEKEYRKVVSGSAQPQLPIRDLKNFTLTAPSLIEQEMIVCKARKIDERISCERELLKKLQKQKSGLMHDLLTGKVSVTPDPESIC